MFPAARRLLSLIFKRRRFFNLLGLDLQNPDVHVLFIEAFGLNKIIEVFLKDFQ